MTPKIVKQKKVFLNQGNSAPTNFSRLEATASAEIPITVSRTIIHNSNRHFKTFIWRTNLKTGMTTMSKLDGTKSMTKRQNNLLEIRGRKFVRLSISHIHYQEDRKRGISTTKFVRNRCAMFKISFCNYT